MLPKQNHCKQRHLSFRPLQVLPNGLKKALITWATCHHFMDCTGPAAVKASLQMPFQRHTLCFQSFSIPEGLNKVWTNPQNVANKKKKNRNEREEADATTAPGNRLNPVVSSRFKKPRNMALYNKISVENMEFYNNQAIKSWEIPLPWKADWNTALFFQNWIFNIIHYSQSRPSLPFVVGDPFQNISLLQIIPVITIPKHLGCTCTIP